MNLGRRWLALSVLLVIVAVAHAAEDLDARIVALRIQTLLGKCPATDWQQLKRARATPAQQAEIEAIGYARQRVMEHDAIGVVAAILPSVAGERAAATWWSATRAKQRQWAATGTAPEGRVALAPFPDPVVWTIPPHSAPIMIEMIAALRDLHAIETAVAAARKLASTSNGDERIQGEASAALGDVLLLAEDAQQAVKAFAFAIERAEYGKGTSIADAQIADLLVRARDGHERAKRVAQMHPLAKWYVPPTNSASAQLTHIAVDFEAGRATQAQRAQVITALKQPVLMRLAERIEALMRARVDDDPRRALILLAPHLLADAQPWLAAQRGAVGQLDFPPRSAWKSDATTADAVVVARCLRSGGNPILALDLLRLVTDTARAVDAVELRLLLAEILTNEERLPAAIAELESATAIAEGLRWQSNGASNDDPAGEIAGLRWRVAQARQACADRADSVQYGPDFVAYRHAQRLRLIDGDLPQALAAYAALIKNYPGTIYASAAGAYRVVTLVELSRPGAQPHLRDVQKDIDEQIKIEDSERKGSVLLPSPQNPQEFAATELQVLRQRAAALAAAPRGAAALVAADRAASELAAREPGSPYLGEVWLVLGMSTADDHGNLDVAAGYLASCREWCEEAHRLAAALDRMNIPSQAITVATPPQQRLGVDAWSNRVRIATDPEHVVNRTTAPWYLDEIHSRGLTYAGMVNYLRGDFAAARLDYGEMRLFDAVGRDQEARLGWSSAKRMLWNIDHNRGGCYGSANEMASFRDPAIRVHAFFADLYLETQEYAEAEKRFTDLKLRFSDRLNPDASAYVLFALAVCRSMRNDDEKADKLLTEIDQSYPTAVVRPRAMFMRAVWLIGSSQKNGEEKGLAIFAEIWKRYPASEEGASALYHIGWLAVKSGKPTEGKTALQAYLSQYPQGPYRNAARSYLHQIEIDKTSAKSVDRH